MAQNLLIHTNDQSRIFQEFLDYFNKNREINENSEPYKRNQPLVAEFQNEYPLTDLLDMDLDKYIIGKENANSFCNIIERGKYKYVGPGIGGNSAEKFGIYFNKSKQKYISLSNRNGIVDPESYWGNLRKHIVDMMLSIKTAKQVDDIKDENVFPDLKGMSLVLIKLAFLYNPEMVLAISGKEYLENILKMFNIKIDDNVNTSVRLSFLLNKKIREGIPELKDIEPELLSRILWIFYQQKTNTKHRIWLLAAGNGGDHWEDFYKSNKIKINYDDSCLGSLNSYCSKKEISEILGKSKSNDSLAAWNFCSVMNIGDTVFVKKGTKGILGMGTVDGSYEYDSSIDSYSHSRSIKWENTEEKEIVDNSINLPQKTLTDITDDNLSGYLSGLYNRDNIIENYNTSTYSKEDFLNEVFMSSDEYDTINGLLNRKKNIILAGVPGVGKTFIAKKLIESRGNTAKVEMVQFHQSYSYEDFIQGYRPVDDGGFDLENGVFYNLVMEARKAKREEIETGNLAKDYYIIIDEINRGNLSKIFGELLMLIEADKRNPKWGINLTYSKDDENDFYIPDNLYIIGTMNTADRSLTMVDYALRRRFAFVNLEPKFGRPEFKKYLCDRVEDVDIIDKLIIGYTKLNDYMEKNLGKDFKIGHSYFIPQGQDIENYLSFYKDIVDYEIKPLLEEYFYDDPEKIYEALNLINFEL